jgi:hypothetical protein
LTGLPQSANESVSRTNALQETRRERASDCNWFARSAGIDTTMLTITSNRSFLSPTVPRARTTRRIGALLDFPGAILCRFSRCKGLRPPASASSPESETRTAQSHWRFSNAVRTKTALAYSRTRHDPWLREARCVQDPASRGMKIRAVLG